MTQAESSQVERLAELLKPFIDGTSPYCQPQGDCINFSTPSGDGSFYHTDSPEIEAIEALWGDALDMNSSGADPDKHRQLQVLTGGHCYVRPGERDSFGWVTALLHTPHGYFIE